MRDLAAIWRRIDAAATRAGVPLALRPGASEDAIRAAEAAIGIPFPEDFRASLRVADGQEWSSGDPDRFPWLPGQDTLVPLEAMVEQWREHCQTCKQFYEGDPPVPPEEIEHGTLYHYFWHPRRIPIAGNRYFDQDNTYLDFFPGPRGIAGQLAVFGKGNYGEVIGPSFGAALALYADALEAGDFVVRDANAVPGKSSIKTWGRYIAERAPAP